MTVKDYQENGLPGLRTQRRKARLSKTALAAKIGTSRQAITSWEAGKSWPMCYWLPVLADALSCEIEELFTEDGSEGSGDG